MGQENLNFVIAFLAGLVSFLAPCSGVLVPAFLSHLAGVSYSEIQKGHGRYRTQILVNTALFILGFTIVFTLLGASIGFLSSFVRGFVDTLAKVGGVLIIIFGIYALGLFKISFLERDYRIPTVNLTHFRYLGSFLIGNAFAIGWTPCVGPILAAILVLAGASSSVFLGTGLLLAYSAGLMLPFLVVGVFTAQTGRFLAQHSRVLRYINYVAGALLIFLGILVFTGNLPKLVGKLYFLSPFRI